MVRTIKTGSRPHCFHALVEIGQARHTPVVYEMQHGFREKRSCETQLIMLIDELAKNMHMGKQTDLILLDFSKAFDKVAHEKLLLKLHHYGIRGDTLNGLRTSWKIENKPW